MGSIDSDYNVEAEFRYWASSRIPESSEALDILSGPHAEIQPYSTEVQNIRTSSEAGFNLADHAFQVIKHSSKFLPPAQQSDLDFSDTEQVGLKYWPELCNMIQQELGARLCVAFNSAVRESAGSNKPYQLVHSDISPEGARNFLRSIGPSFFEDVGCSETVAAAANQKAFLNLCNEILQAEKQAISDSNCALSDWHGSNYNGPRWALFSIWRPLETVKQDPLGLMDASSIFTVPSSYSEKHKSYVSMSFMVNDKDGKENYTASNIMPLAPQGKKHQWYWISNQEPDEVYAIKLFDSEAWKTDSRVMPCCPHSAFALPATQTESLPPRRSIETRCFVVW